MLQRVRQQVVVHIRENAEGVASLAESPEGRIRIRERHPARQAVGKEGRARSVYRPPEAPADTQRRFGEDLAIGPICRRVRLGPGVEQGLQHGRWVESDAICSRGVLESPGDARLPVDERPVAVARDHVERGALVASLIWRGSYSIT